MRILSLLSERDGSRDLWAMDARVCLEQRELFIRELLNVRWELVVAPPERLQRV